VHKKSQIEIPADNVNIYQSQKDYAYIEVTAKRSVWRPYFKDLKNATDLPENFWTWPFTDSFKSDFEWYWSNKRNKTDLYIK
jgi:hypothetical protein